MINNEEPLNQELEQKLQDMPVDDFVNLLIRISRERDQYGSVGLVAPENKSQYTLMDA